MLLSPGDYFKQTWKNRPCIVTGTTRRPHVKKQWGFYNVVMVQFLDDKPPYIETCPAARFEKEREKNGPPEIVRRNGPGFIDVTALYFPPAPPDAEKEK